MRICHLASLSAIVFASVAEIDARARAHECNPMRAQAEVRTRKASIAEKEAALAANNPPLFQQIQVHMLRRLSGLSQTR